MAGSGPVISARSIRMDFCASLIARRIVQDFRGKYIAPQPIEQMIKGSRFVNQGVLIGNGRKFRPL